jgi:hypothetical protein
MTDLGAISIAIAIYCGLKAVAESLKTEWEGK